MEDQSDVSLHRCWIYNLLWSIFWVDDTDLLQTLNNNSSAQEVINKLQQLLNTWEGILAATSGAIVPEKTFWYQIDFAWQGGDWRYKSIAESPGKLMVRDITGCHRTLKCLELHQSMETLVGDIYGSRWENWKTIHQTPSLGIGLGRKYSARPINKKRNVGCTPVHYMEDTFLLSPHH